MASLVVLFTNLVGGQAVMRTPMSVMARTLSSGHAAGRSAGGPAASSQAVVASARGPDLPDLALPDVTRADLG